MPIKIPNSLPARETLEGENIFVMTEYRAIHQDIRPLNLLILNLMPTKIATETQLLRKLSNTPLQIQVELLQHHQPRRPEHGRGATWSPSTPPLTRSRTRTTTAWSSPAPRWKTWTLRRWTTGRSCARSWSGSKTHVHSTLHICWGAQAGLYYHYGIPKYALPQKLFGVFDHRVLKPSSPLFRGFDDRVLCPPLPATRKCWRRTSAKSPVWKLLAVSEEAGVFAVKTEDSRQFFLLGHLEYDRNTLAQEYWRDVDRGLDIQVPRHYFPNDDPNQTPIVRWRSAGQLIYTNWLNYYVYQTTPYDLTRLDRT